MPARKRRMSAEEFEAIRPFLKISPQRIEAARMALVDQGLTLQEIGNVFGWTRQAVDDAAKSVWKAFENYQNLTRLGNTQARALREMVLLPPGLEQATFIATPEVIAHLRDAVEGVSATPKKEKPSR